MWLAIGKFFSAILKFVLGVFTGIFNWAREHPREALIVALAVLALVASNWQMHKWATAKAHEKDAKTIATLRDSLAKANAETAKANEETAKRDAKITKLEGDSKTAATATEEALKGAEEERKAIMSEYEQKLKVEKGKYKIVYVKDPTGKDVPVTIDPQGKVICERFSETFLSTTNKLVDNANKPLKK
jgi:hypothetical protein